jgi:hypothetical protein
MKRLITTTALLGISMFGLTFGAAVYAEAADTSRLAASAGIPAAAAGELTLTEIAAIKFNNDSGRDGQQRVADADAPIMVDAVRHAQLIESAGLTAADAEGMTLSQLSAAALSAGSDQDEAVVVVMSSRGPIRSHPRLVAAAGLTPAEAQGMSLSAIAAAKFNRDTRPGDYQATGF